MSDFFENRSSRQYFWKGEGTMSIDDQTIAAIREAVRLSPGSIPLRQHLAG